MISAEQVAHVVRDSLLKFLMGFQDFFTGFILILASDESPDALTDSVKKDTVAATRTAPPLTILRLRRMQGKAVEPVQPAAPAAQKKATSFRSHIAKFYTLNLGFVMGSMLLFSYIILPTVSFFCNSLATVVFPSNALLNYSLMLLQELLSLIFHILWVTPLFLISTVVNHFWYEDFAGFSGQRMGRSGSTTGITGTNFIANLAYSILFNIMFCIQAYVFYGVTSVLLLCKPNTIEPSETALSGEWLITASVALLGSAVYHTLHMLCMAGYIMHYALLYALYAFEYRWLSERLPVGEQLQLVQLHWCYFAGFGMLLAVATIMITSLFYSSVAFSLGFPLLIIAAFGARDRSFPKSQSRKPHLAWFRPSIACANFISNTLMHRWFKSRMS